MKPKIAYHKNGQIQYEVWKNKARKQHRLDGPAYRSWYENGQLGSELWYVNGEHHRLDGPAVQFWSDSGQVRWEVWHINGVKYNTKAEFQVAVDLYKANEIAELF